MISSEYAIEFVQAYLKRLGIKKDIPENPEYILTIINEKIKDFIGTTYSLTSHAEIETDGSTEYTLPDKVYNVTQVDLDGYRIASKITEREVKSIAGDVV